MEYQPSTFYGDKTGNLRVERRCSVDKGRHRRGQLRTRLPVLFPPHIFFSSLFLLRILEEGGRVSVDGEGLVLLFSLWFVSPAVSIGRGAPFLLLSVRPHRVSSRPVAVAVASDVLRADCEAGGVF